MADLRRFGFADFLLFVLVLAVAAGARSGFLITCCDYGRNAGPLRVQDELPHLINQPTELQQVTQSVRESFAFSANTPLGKEGVAEDTAHLSPGYPWFLGLLGRWLEVPNFDQAVRWIQAGLGSLTAAFYFLFARRGFHSSLVGLLAGLLTALHPFWVINTAAFDDGVLTAFLLSFALALGTRAAQTGGPFASLLYGLMLAVLALTRATYLPFAFVALGWFLLRSREVQRGWLCAALAFLGFANGLTPWTVRNWQVFQQPIPIVDSAWLELWGGNHPGATGGPVPWSAIEGRRTDDTAKATEPERYAQLAPDVLAEVRDNTVATVQRRLWAGLYFFFGERWFRDGKLAESMPDAEGIPDWFRDAYPGALAGTLLGMLFFAALGWRWTYAWRLEAMPSAQALLWGFLPYFLSHAEALSGPRLPLDGVLLSYAAFAIVCLLPGLNSNLLQGPRLVRVRDDFRS